MTDVAAEDVAAEAVAAELASAERETDPQTFSSPTDGRATPTEPIARAALVAALHAITAEPAVANFLLRGPTVPTSTVTRIDFEADVAAEVISDVLAFARDLAERELLPYDPSYLASSGQALIDDLSEVPELAQLHARILDGTPALDGGGTGGDDESPIAAIAHKVDGPDGGAVVVYRVKGPGIATKRPRGIRILVPRGGVYERVTEELVYYQPRFDVLVTGGVVFATAPSTLQRSLGSDRRAREMARTTFREATRRIDIEGMTDLADAISTDPAMIAKMAQLNRVLDADPSYAEFLTTEKLLGFLAENPQILILVEGEGSARHLVFEPAPQKRYLIPKTLADDFLRSELTDRRYEVGSKQRLDT